jgi:hypothetical protein
VGGTARRDQGPGGHFQATQEVNRVDLRPRLPQVLAQARMRSRTDPPSHLLAFQEREAPYWIVGGRRAKEGALPLGRCDGCRAARGAAQWAVWSTPPRPGPNPAPGPEGPGRTSPVPALSGVFPPSTQGFSAPDWRVSRIAPSQTLEDHLGWRRPFPELLSPLRQIREREEGGTPKSSPFRTRQANARACR